ncbi:hypothetical protein HMPREF1544_04337 [Mucor circinelloides 1006PhL]|uniref:Uncharacterized protein n=1 Tax=Mucor circinelloides f. circinelloides (strain 1006PhL) TaxID=1220926 RepID=S2K0Y4_MUCC1|nr:hypothetical protein HMPREF1544_04337 [Mucor circinelloides 1006PhL]
MLLRMRQCADLPDLIAKKKTQIQQLVRLMYNNLIKNMIDVICKDVFCLEYCV